MSSFFKEMNKTAIIIAIIVGFSIIAYGYLNVRYKNKVFEAEQKEKSYNRKQLDGCLTGLGSVYWDLWNRKCKDRGLGDNCRLPVEISEEIDEKIDNYKADCFKRYPVK